MKIGVTGAFGFLGANFVAELLARGGCEIVAYASRTRSNPLFDPRAVRIEELDVLDPEAMARAFKGLDAVAHFAGKVDFRAAAKRAVWDADVLGTMRLFEAALAAGVGRVLALSSINVLGEPEPGSLADEGGSPYGIPGFPCAFASPAAALEAVESSSRGDYAFLRRSSVAYFDAKLAAWELAKRYAKERGLPLVSVFPGTAVGPGDIHRSITALVDGVWEGRLRLTFAGASSFVDSRDFARGAALALERGRAGEGYVVSGRDGHNLGYREFMELVGKVARESGGRGIGKPLVVPRALAVGAGAAAERLAPGMGLAAAVARAGAVRNVCSSAKARAELGYEPRASLEDAIRECRRFGEAARKG